MIQIRSGLHSTPCENGCLACPSLSRLVRDEGREGKRKKPVLAVTFLRSDVARSTNLLPLMQTDIYCSLPFGICRLFFMVVSPPSLSLSLTLVQGRVWADLEWRQGVGSLDYWCACQGEFSSSVPPTKGRFVWPLCGLTLAGYRNLFVRGVSAHVWWPERRFEAFSASLRPLAPKSGYTTAQMEGWSLQPSIPQLYLTSYSRHKSM